MAQAQAAQPPETRIGSAGPIDQVFQGVVTGLSGLVIVILVGLIALLIVDSLPSIQRYGLGFVTTSTWDPVSEQFGAWPYIYGTIVTSLLALLIATPVAVGAALFLAEYAPPLAARPGLVRRRAAGGDPEHHLRPLGLLRPGAGHARRGRAVPQGRRSAPIPVLERARPGAGARASDILVAGVILAIMILPTIMSVSREVILTVPEHPARGDARAGRDEVGDDHLGGAAVRPRRHRSARRCSAWPARSARRWRSRW